jgi:hypothetical protein
MEFFYEYLKCKALTEPNNVLHQHVGNYYLRKGEGNRGYAARALRAGELPT